MLLNLLTYFNIDDPTPVELQCVSDVSLFSCSNFRKLPIPPKCIPANNPERVYPFCLATVQSFSDNDLILSSRNLIPAII